MGPVTGMANNVMEVLATVPTTLAAAWGVWLVAGVVLATWYRRARLEPALAPAPPPASASKAVTRSKSASRSLSGVREVAAPVAPTEEAPVVSAYEPPPGVAPVIAREKKPIVIGDPFGDLATLLDQAVASVAVQAPVAAPVAAPPPDPHRAPTDSPILSSSGFPMRRGGDEPKLS